MELLNLYAEVQANPRNINAYRNIIKYYKKRGMFNEAEAFNMLVEEIMHGSDSSNSDEEQPDNS
jgi:intergrase/recombinase